MTWDPVWLLHLAYWHWDTGGCHWCQCPVCPELRLCCICQVWSLTSMVAILSQWLSPPCLSSPLRKLQPENISNSESEKGQEGVLGAWNNMLKVVKYKMYLCFVLRHKQTWAGGRCSRLRSSGEMSNRDCRCGVILVYTITAPAKHRKIYTKLTKSYHMDMDTYKTIFMP